MRCAIILLCCLLQAISFTGHAQGSATIQSGLSLKYIVRQPQKKVNNSPIVIMLHGYGSNEADLFELSRYIPDSFIVISARAPYAQGGGYRWFDRDRSQQKYEAVKEQLENSRKLLLQFVQQVGTKYHTPGSKICVMGFSQGAIMSYAVGLSSPASVKGIGVLSGVLPQPVKEHTQRSAALSKLRIFISHGTTDDILPYADGKAGNDYLVNMGIRPEFHSYEGIAHYIAPQTLTDLVKWLVK